MGLREERDLIDQVLAAAEEREAAYTVRETDRERWKAAKQKYAEMRTLWREAYAFKRALDEAAQEAAPAVAAATTVTPTPGEVN